MNRIPRHAQRGSAFFLILLSVFLLAALSYAVYNSSRQSMSGFGKEQAKLAAEEIFSYTDTVRQAVQNLKLRGCADTEINLVSPQTAGDQNNTLAPDDESCNVFSANGGKVVYRPLEAAWLAPGSTYNQWWFNGQTAIELIGTDEPELMMWINHIKPEICEQMNMIAMNKPPAAETVSTHTTGFLGAYSAGADGIGDDAADDQYRGQSRGCYGEYVYGYSYYATLIAR